MTRNGTPFRNAACLVAALFALTLASGAHAANPEREALPIGGTGAAGATGVGAGQPSTLRTVVSLGVVVMLIGGAGFGLRTLARMGVGKTLGAGAGSPSGVCEVLARYPAGRGLTLVVLKIDRRVLLLGQVASTTGRVDSVSTLTTFDDAADVASLLMKTQDEQGHSLSAKFREVLSGFHTARHPHADDEQEDDGELRRSTRTADGDEVSLISDDHGAAGAGASLGAFRKSVSSLRGGGRGARA